VNGEEAFVVVGKAEDLISSVLPLNTQKYAFSQPQYSVATGRVEQQYVDYVLSAQDSTAHVQCTFQNGQLFTLIAAAQNDTLLYSVSSDDFFEAAKSVMSKYQFSRR